MWAHMWRPGWTRSKKDYRRYMRFRPQWTYAPQDTARLLYYKLIHCPRYGHRYKYGSPDFCVQCGKRRWM